MQTFPLAANLANLHAQEVRCRVQFKSQKEAPCRSQEKLHNASSKVSKALNCTIEVHQIVSSGVRKCGFWVAGLRVARFLWCMRKKSLY